MRLVAAQDGLDTGDQLLGIKGLLHVVVGTQLEAQHLVEDLSLGGEHDDGRIRCGAHLPADLVAVDPRQHEVQQDEVGLIGPDRPEGGFPVAHDLRVETLLGQVEADQLSDIGIVIDDEDLVFCNHVLPLKNILCLFFQNKRCNPI